MHDLKSPDEFAGRSAQSDDGVGPFAVSFANAAEIIRGSAAGGNKNEVVRGIDRKTAQALPAPSARGAQLVLVNQAFVRHYL
jgi:hypothetical protein